MTWDIGLGEREGAASARPPPASAPPAGEGQRRRRGLRRRACGPSPEGAAAAASLPAPLLLRGDPRPCRHAPPRRARRRRARAGRRERGRFPLLLVLGVALDDLPRLVPSDVVLVGAVVVVAVGVRAGAVVLLAASCWALRTSARERTLLAPPALLPAAEPGERGPRGRGRAGPLPLGSAEEAAAALAAAAAESGGGREEGCAAGAAAAAAAAAAAGAGVSRRR